MLSRYRKRTPLLEFGSWEYLVLQKRRVVSGHHTILAVGYLYLMILVIIESGSAYATSKLLR